MPGPNPYRDLGADVVLLGDFQVPGFVVAIADADREFDWSVQKGTDTSGAITVCRGSKLCEAFTVTVAAPDVASFDALYDLRDVLLPPAGQKPPTFLIDNLVINFVGITRCSLKKLAQPEWNAKNGEWQLKVIFIEYSPSKATKTGPADPAKPDDAAEKTPNDEATQQIHGLLAKIATFS